MTVFALGIAAKIAALLAALGLGYKWGKGNSSKLEQQVVSTSLTLQKEQNAKTVEKTSTGKSDLDLVNDAIREGSCGKS